MKNLKKENEELQKKLNRSEENLALASETIHSIIDQKTAEEAMKLIAAGGCYALFFWSKPDADRLYPFIDGIQINWEQEDRLVPTLDRISVAEKAIELIKKGIEIFNKSV